MRSTPLLLALPLAACAPKAPPTPTVPPELAPIHATVSAALDPAVAPCDDFYRYACGGWEAQTTIPGDQSRWSRSFSVIHENNQGVLKDILTAATEQEGGLLGPWYDSCVDTEAMDARGAEPVAPLLAQVEAADDLPSLLGLVGQLHGRGVVTLLDWGVFAGFDDPGTNVLHLGQGGLGLPDRDYYFPEESDQRGNSLLSDYEANLARLLILSGVEPDAATARAARIVAFETELARVSKRRQELRDPEKTWNPVDRAGLEALAPDLPWAALLGGLGADGVSMFNASVPEYFGAVQALLGSTDLAVLKEYVAWHALLDAAPALSDKFRQAHFEFFRAALAGQKERRPRWKECVDATNGALGDLLSQAYVDQRFSGDSKPTAVAMVQSIEAAFEASLADLAWMDPTTAERARTKARAVTNKIGFPDKWRSFDGLALGEGWYENRAAGTAFEIARQLGKIGGPVDPDEWFMPASMVNAYYNPLQNEIVFPAGILQPPFFDAAFPPEMNFGAIGMVIGHELTHGFDDSGRKFDADGQMKVWWEDEATTRYEEAAGCVTDLYSGFEVQRGLTVNGELTLGENIADLGGIKQSHQGWRASTGGDFGAASGVAGLTRDQLFFVAFAQSWCSLATPEIEQMLLTVDSHSPARFRVNGSVSQYSAFAEAFGCAAGTPMAPAERCAVW